MGSFRQDREGSGPEEEMRTGTGHPGTPCQNLGCYHAESGRSTGASASRPVKALLDVLNVAIIIKRAA